MAHWYDALLALLAAQPPEVVSVTLTLAEVEALAGGRMPAGGLTRAYWRQRRPGGMGHRLMTLGWRVGRFGRGQTVTITFVRYAPAPHP